MKIVRLTFSFLLLFYHSYSSRNVFWSENFNQTFSSCSPNSSPFNWTVSNIGTQGSEANDWYVYYLVNSQINHCYAQNTNNGFGALYIGYGNSSCDSATYGPLYKKGCNNVTKKIVSSPIIDCSGRSNINLDLDIVARGIYITDYACILYSEDGGTSWDTVESHVFTGSCQSTPLQGYWQHRTISLPTSADNNSNVVIGFSWINNDDCIGTNISVGIDNIELSVECTNNTTFNLGETSPFCAGHIFQANASQSGLVYNWDFGNGTTSTLINPFINYANPGNYTITLVTTDTTGCQNIYSQNILVEGFNINTSLDDSIICPFGCVNFSSIIVPSNIFGTRNLYDWNYNDQQANVDSSSNPHYCFTHPGIHNVVLTIRNPQTQCTRSALLHVYVDTCGFPVLNTINITSDGQICKNSCVNFSSDAYDATTYLWTFPGSSTYSSTMSNPTSICYSIPGTFPVTLSITNSYGTITLSSSVTVYDEPPIPIITYISGNLTCNTSLMYTYIWYVLTIGGWVEAGSTRDLAPLYFGYDYKVRVYNGPCYKESASYFLAGP